MKTMDCRMCGGRLFSKPLLHYKNMPKAAQFLPDAKSLKEDKGIHLEVYQCSACGLVQLSNNPVSYFREVIRAVKISEEMKTFRLRQFRHFVEKYSLRGKKVIEIGCGQGEYSSLMQQCGVQVYGLEASQASITVCKKNGLRAIKGFVDNLAYAIPNTPFNAFFMLNFLEHLPDPNSTLRGIYNNLSDDAVGLVEVPNFDMILRNNLFSEFILDHIFYFTEKTLKAILELNGFDVLESKTVWHDYIISCVVRKRNQLDVSGFHTHQAEIIKDIEKYIGNYKKIAIWGAGHQALTILSLLHLTDKISYVVDSAPFKQNKYTPVTHIPIVSPDTLRSNPIDAIVVMAASYSDEVVKNIRQKYHKTIKVAILRDFGLEIV